MELPILYKRTKTSAIQYWKVEVRQSDLLEGAQIRKESGQLGTTNPVVHVETVHEGKNLNRSNVTTPLQQARSQAESDWKKKKDEGYKSLEDLGIREAKYGAHFLPQFLEDALPRFNSDANGMTKPMLAKAVSWDKVIYPCYVQPKLDGVRCLMVVEPRMDGDLSIQFLSRTGKRYTTLDHIAVDVAKADPREPFILDGEIYSDELTFQEITAAVKKQRDDSLKLKFRCYDIVGEDGQEDRILQAFDLVRQIKSACIEFVPTDTVHNKAEVMAAHDRYVSVGYEGAIIRLMDGHYAQGQRSSHLLKVKEFMSGEFALLDFEFGQRGAEDLIAICTTDKGVRFKAKMQGTKDSKEKLIEWWCATGKNEKHQLTVKYFGMTDEGSVRFPIGVAVRDYE